MAHYGNRPASYPDNAKGSQGTHISQLGSLLIRAARGHTWVASGHKSSPSPLEGRRRSARPLTSNLSGQACTGVGRGGAS
jgi:hypothetical protein